MQKKRKLYDFNGNWCKMPVRPSESGGYENPNIAKTIKTMIYYNKTGS